MKQLLSDKTKNLIGYVLVAVSMIAALFFMPEFAEGENFGVWNLLPPVMIFLFIILTKNILEGFFWCALVTSFMYYGATGGLWGFVESHFISIGDWDNWWIIYLFLMCGTVTMIFSKSGAGTCFVRWISTKVKSTKTIMFALSLVTVPLALDDYMTLLITGSVFSPLLDEKKVPREMTCYIMRAFATAMSAMLPFGGWAIFFAKQCENVVDLGTYSSGLSWFIGNVLPHLYFPMASCLVGWLVIFGVIPIFGKMKAAYNRVENGGPIIPKKATDDDDDQQAETAPEPKEGVNISHFLFPILAIVAFGFYFEWDMSYAMTWGILATFVYYVITKIFNTTDCLNCCIDGFAYMSEMALLMGLALMMIDNMNNMGFIEYVISAVGDNVAPNMLPLIIFLLFSVTEILSTFNYALFLMAVPIVAGLAANIGADVGACLAALMSCGVLGFELSFSSDGGILACGSCGKLDLYEQTLCQYPYIVMSWVLALIAFVATCLI